MFRWILQHRTYTLILVLVIGWFLYTGYTNVWQPAAMAAEAHETAGESVEFGKELLEFLAQKDILDLLKTILPILLPIFLYKRKENMDTNVRQTTNYVVREKMGIADRRKNETPAQQLKRRTDKAKAAVKKAITRKKK